MGNDRWMVHVCLAGKNACYAHITLPLHVALPSSVVFVALPRAPTPRLRPHLGPSSTGFVSRRPPP